MVISGFFLIILQIYIKKIFFYFKKLIKFVFVGGESEVINKI